MSDRQAMPRTVELVNSGYQPTKAELAEAFDLNIPGDTVKERIDSLGRALTQTVNIRWIDKSRSRESRKKFCV